MQTSSIPTNPFATPSLAVVEAEAVAELPNQQNPPNAGASEEDLRRLCSSMAIADVSYVLGCVIFLAPFVLSNLSYDIQAAAMFLQYGCFIVTWVCLFSICRMTQGIIGAIFSCVVFPIPLFGSLIFFSALERSNTFLRHNGYRRKFIGAEPNPKERQQMAINENYYPSARFDHQGNRLSRFKLTLTNSFFLTLFVCWLVMMLTLMLQT